MSDEKPANRYLSAAKTRNNGERRRRNDADKRKDHSDTAGGHCR